jgi:hypothetical protein
VPSEGMTILEPQQDTVNTKTIRLGQKLRSKSIQQRLRRITWLDTRMQREDMKGERKEGKDKIMLVPYVAWFI